MAVSVRTTPDFAAGRPERLFAVDGYRAEGLASGSRSYDGAADGRFLMGRAAQGLSPSTQITVVLNWVEELQRLMSPDR